MKFIYSDERKSSQHWEECQRKKAPFIEITRIKENYANIFFDVSDLGINFERITGKIKSLYLSYVEFFLIPNEIVHDLLGQDVFLNAIVKLDHADFIAEQLYDFIVREVNNK